MRSKIGNSKAERGFYRSAALIDSSSRFKVDFFKAALARDEKKSFLSSTLPVAWFG